MADIAVKVENLGKRYRIGTARTTGSLMLREVVTNALSRPFRRFSHINGAHVKGSEISSSYIWALQNVSFEVPRGQILGIICPNGAGKSTLLKILSRITRPTEGRVELHGRVASLLEVGTGFHPELTGRENIYLSGSLFGMRKTEIDRKLDEIVAFAEIEKFIETPVKHYSSGMYVRLAFAVAAHLEPEILILDEVLAVGDVTFQRKCLNKMEDVKQRGRTVLFVSHSMPAVTRLCDRALLIEDGAIQQDGRAATVTSAYLLSKLNTTAERTWPDPANAPGNDIARLHRVRVCVEDGVTAASVDIREPIGIEMVYDVLKPGHVLLPFYRFFNEAGLCVFIAQDAGTEWRGRPRPLGRFTSVAWIPGNLLAEGTLLVSAGLYTLDPFTVHFIEKDTVAFHVIESADGSSARGEWDGNWEGVFRPLLKWTTQVCPLPSG